MNTRILCVCFICLSSTLAAAADSSDSLTLEQALETARAHRPSLRQAQASVESARARVDQTRAPLLPQVSASIGYSRSTANYTSRPGSVPTAVDSTTSSTSFNTFDFFSTGISASLLVWDFGQTLDRFRAANVNVEAQEQLEKASLQQSDYTVRNAFFAARASKALVNVARETLESQKRHLGQIQGFVEVGRRPEIDLAQVRTDLANAQLQLINAENQYATGKAVLNQAMGIARSTNYNVADQSMAEIAGEDLETDALVDMALKAKPEVAAMEKQLRAQQLTISSIRGGYWPSLGVSTGLTDNGRALDSLAWNWNGGVSLNWAIFQGGATRGQEREALANLKNLEAQAEILRQQIRLDVEQARLAVVSAKAALVAATEAVVAAREQLRLSEARYQTGVGNIIELGDAQVAVTNASANQIQAEYKLASARAQLSYTLGQGS